MKQPQHSHISVIQINKLAETPKRNAQFSSRESSSESSMGIKIDGTRSDTRSDSLNLTEEESKKANEDYEQRRRTSVHATDSINRSSDETLTDEDLSLVNSDGDQEEEMLIQLQEG